MRLELDATISAPPLQADTHTQPVDLGEARSSLNQGIKAAQSGNRLQARGLLLRATELDPQNENAWLWLASISEYPEELLGFLNHVLDINPENQRALEWKTATNSLLARTFVQRGIDAVHEGQSDFAAECFQTALEHDDRNAVAWMWMASLSVSKEVKVELLERAVSIDPKNSDAREALDEAKASIRRDRMMDAKDAAVGGRKEDALRMLDSLLAVDPSSIEAWTMRSHLVDSFEEKIVCFESILEVDPENLAAKAGRESLLALFGSSKVAVPEQAGQPDAEEAAVEEAVHEPSASDDVDMWTNAIDPFESPAEPVAESTVGESADETFHSAEEPAYSFAPQAEDLAAVDPEGDRVEEAEPVNEEPEQAYDASEAVDLVSFDASQVAVDESVSDDALQEAEVHVEDPVAVVEEPAAPVVEKWVVKDSASVEADYDQQQAKSWPEDHEQPPAADPQAETVEFSYAELYGAASYDDSEKVFYDQPRMNDVGTNSHPEIPMPEADLPASPVTPEQAHLAEPEAVMVPEVQAAACPFCSEVNSSHEISCSSCRAVLTISDLELLLGNQTADTNIVRRAVDDMERQRLLRSLGSDELVTLGLGHLNLRNLQFGYSCLSEASRTNPNDVVLAGQVNALHIRLEEIKAQEEAHLRMPKGKRILVVDDSPTVRKLIAGKLEKSGHQVICANDGVEAMERLENMVPDLVLLDINMPRMDGYQVCKLIRSNDKTKNVTVVMISGKDGFFDKVRGRMAGTTGYITKPFGPETLMKAVEVYLSGEVPEHDEL
jgi:CheY-like chemotaxis protein